MPASVIQRSFAAGEIAPALAARADLVKYVTGLRTCRNFLVRREGGVDNRPGTRYCGSCKTTSIAVKLAKYISETDGESQLLEIGNGYVRFWQNGGLVTVTNAGVPAWDAGTAYVIGDLALSGGVVYYCIKPHTNHVPPNATYWAALPASGGTASVYELPLIFGTDLPNVEQEGKVLTLTHRNHPPYEMIYFGATAWVLQAVDTAAVPIAAPTGVVLTPGGVGTRRFAYVVTAAVKDSYEEGPASAQVSNNSCADPTAAAPHVLTWTADPNAVEYYVYSDPFNNGVYGFLGTAASNGFHDVGNPPDFTLTPPVARSLFAAAGDYPHVSGTFQQRRFFAQTIHAPDSVWASRTGFRSNFGISSPLQDDDSLTLRLAGNNSNAVTGIVGLKELIALTGGGAWTIGDPRAPLSPSNLGADQQTYVGAGNVRPVAIGNSLIYVQARGVTVRDVQFDQQVEGLAGRDLTIYASHLVDAFTIAELDYQLSPHSIVWACRSDGTLLGLTYIREQELLAWHRHDSAAQCRFEHVQVVPETSEDVVYVLTRRTINGGFVRYIERLESRAITNLAADAFFVDAGLTYQGAPANTVSGLGHLEGQTVAVLGDGAVVAGAHVVTGGALPTLPASYSTIHVGLPITADLESLNLDVNGGQTVLRDKRKRVGSITVITDSSARTFQVGPDSTHLRPYQLRAWQTPGAIVTEELEIALESAYGDNGRVFLRHTDPLPLTVLGWVPNVLIGG